MARYRGPVCRLCRRSAQKLFLKGQRCFGPKCGFERRSQPPGNPGRGFRGRRRSSDYGLQLREKQKLRHIYGVFEKQFRRYVREAERRRGISSENLLQLLERRLDNVVYRAGFATSRAQARQLVNHGHVAIAERRVDISSRLLSPGDVVKVRERSRDMLAIQQAIAAGAAGGSLSWLQVDNEDLSVNIVGLPTRDEIDADDNEQLVMEFYSR